MVPKLQFKPDKFVDVLLTGVLAIALERALLHYFPAYARLVREDEIAAQAASEKHATKTEQAKSNPEVVPVPDNLYFIERRPTNSGGAA
jgi:hypothetical protein